MFEGFTDNLITVGEVRLRVRYAGEGPPVLLIHGHPRTGATWHRVAPLLVAAGFAVVCPDMRGYGRSSKVAVRVDHGQQSKRAVADDLAQLMTVLGHQSFAVAGHDRGSYVASRLALDHPDRVSRLTVMDGVPIVEAIERCDAQFARLWYHWFFFAQADKPERAIGVDPIRWYGPDAASMGAENYAEVVEAMNDPQVVRAMLEDYRAGLTVDLEADRADRLAGRTISCPTQLLWSSDDDLETLYGDPLAIWRLWAPDLQGHAVSSGHHLAEENPRDLAASLISFLRLGPAWSVSGRRASPADGRTASRPPRPGGCRRGTTRSWTWPGSASRGRRRHPSRTRPWCSGW